MRAPHRDGEFAQRGERSLGAEFLHEPEQSVDDHDGDDREGVHRFAKGAGNRRRADQDPDDQAGELAREQLEQGSWRCLRQLIRPRFDEAFCGRGGGQPPFEVRAEERARRGRLLGMPMPGHRAFRRRPISFTTA